MPLDWFGDFASLCISACVPLATCNLLSGNSGSGSNTAGQIASALHSSIPTNITSTSTTTAAAAAATPTTLDGCMLHEWRPIRDLGALIVSCLGIVFLTHQLMYKSRRLDRAVGRSEMRLLFLTFIWIQVLQMFTIGGIFSSSRTVMIWTSALELGAIACFFWILLVNVFILFQIVEDGTTRVIRFILLTSAAIMGGTTFLALDLAMDITRHHDGHSAELYVLTLIFPASAAVLFALLACTLVLRRLDTYKSIAYLGLALAAFGGSQAVLFMLSPGITHSSNGHVNASTLAFLLNILSIMLLYLFWRDITDDTWGDGIF